jgi:hypothetical protein
VENEACKKALQGKVKGLPCTVTCYGSAVAKQNARLFHEDASFPLSPIARELSVAGGEQAMTLVPIPCSIVAGLYLLDACLSISAITLGLERKAYGTAAMQAHVRPQASSLGPMHSQEKPYDLLKCEIAEQLVPIEVALDLYKKQVLWRVVSAAAARCHMVPASGGVVFARNSGWFLSSSHCSSLSFGVHLAIQVALRSSNWYRSIEQMCDTFKSVNHVLM